MKFDKIIMNPPYLKTLHLQIVEEVLKYLKENGECINLSPVRWLQDYAAQYKKRNTDYKKFEETISKYIQNLELIDNDKANKVFGIEILMKLGIYTINKSKQNNIYKSVLKYKFITEKILSKICSDNGYNNCNKINYNDNLQNFVLINRMAPPMKYNKPMYYILKTWAGYFINGKNINGDTYNDAKQKCKESTRGNIYSDTAVIFDKEKETKNCYNSMLTNFVKFVTFNVIVDINVYQQYLPWMNNSINPRTGLKGYESEWTNEDFYQYFDINEDEQKIIEETMKDVQ